MIIRSTFADVAIPEVPYHSLILQKAQEWNDRLAFIDGPTGRTLTHGQVASRARQVASSLARRGFKKGDVFAIYSPNIPEYAIAFHATAMLGGIVTTVNPLYTVEELAFQLDDTKAKYLVTVPTFVEKAVEAARQSRVEEVFAFGDAQGATPFASLLEGDGQVPEVAIDPRRDICVMPYSSGTSGRPKGVLLTHRNLVAITMQIVGTGIRSVDQDARVLALLPFYHIYGMVVLMNYPLYFGALAVTMPRFDLEQFLKITQDNRVTHLYLVPPIVIALAKHPLVDQYDLSSVRLINSGAAPLDEGIQKQCAQRVGCMVGQGYGMTETSLAISVSTDDPSMVRAGSSGRLLPNMEAKILDIASGAELGRNERGEIVVRGPNVMCGYLNDRDATARTLDEDGWLRTGDIGYVDDDGYFFVLDRAKELIKYKGFQVAPAELEALLLANPAIADAAVIGSPDDEAGEIPKAFVVTKSSITSEEIMAYVASRVAPHKKIRRVEIVDQIPKSPSGKILRRVLLERERDAMKE